MPGDIVPGSVGRLIANMRAKIVDEDGRSLPPGPSNTGELLLAGPNVMKGYLHNPKATAATIVDGWLLTGDSASHAGLERRHDLSQRRLAITPTPTPTSPSAARQSATATSAATTSSSTARRS